MAMAIVLLDALVYNNVAQMSDFLVICCQQQHLQASEMYSFCLIINEQTP